MNRRDSVLGLLALGVGGVPAAVFPQANRKPWRVGVIYAGAKSNSPAGRRNEDAFLAGMKDHGYLAGQDLILDARYAEGDPARIPVLVQEILSLKPDVLLGSSANVASAMHAKTATIPIVICTVSDAVGIGLAHSLARPGKNVTGLSMQLHELGAKHFEVMSELLPRMQRVAVITDALQPKLLSDAYEQLAQRAATAKGAKLTLHRVENLDGIRKLFGSFAKLRTDAVLLNPSPRFNNLRREICQLAANIRLPSIGWDELIAEAGALTSYGPSFTEAYRRVAYFVDRILKGAKPADLPIEQPTKFSLVINAKTAKKFDIKFPQTILLRADRVIE